MGRNVAAGMTGGLAYILDEDNTLIDKVCVNELQFSSHERYTTFTNLLMMFFVPVECSYVAKLHVIVSLPCYFPKKILCFFS